ncbi:hypothetical protein [Bacteroides pyogenes]|uniref:hypothetical protein n=1 Tax=Bacteroides pyogenes TaxID=310300 RepID=UPI001BA7E0A7|nr:hypothetical protein [Bacteroides pyogenes]MBR8726600.1 hypothetical protein [Bacteroides pyogenes]MBR8739984.1 hypothetical protein [Bacteroides pyogenes]MBR8755750.1 hypothetical protein [Bacteroides pyogenes]MBR8797053.1 hypothetical protein [Bacteroides pyogenes]MBR8810665.1 hypothetical protein [Bacteroides pyogenes]
MKRPPIRFIIQIDEDRLSELIYYWNYYDKPCSLLLRKPKTEGLAAVELTVDCDETADFVLRVKEKTGARLFQR